MHIVKKIGVIGAGQMGRGIAQVAIQSGFETFLYDSFSESLEKGSIFIKEQMLRGVSKGKWTEEASKKAQELLHLETSLEGLSDCDLVIEAATERKDIKFKIFQDCDKIIKEGAILASNTSSISITEIAAQTRRPSKVAGMHFMNPVPVMKLVEGIKGLETSEETFESVASVSKTMGKIFVKANDTPGFAVNRILMPMINEAVYALYEGVASVEDIDSAMKLGTNQPMGPLELADFIGLDTCLAIMGVLHDGLGDTKYRPCPLLKKYVLAGRLGKKSGRGFYEY
ncbi:MAG: 3-hydroxybutyryl-CoA dehydrogenase [Halobacteriovoraceae bacterium]|nr:3-hydroxybutyryl-CoA dehydrogenase [Halobacteriovoraceae bacterium]|tara:strand:- start:148 stop:999 length:852 start_codon:yes stop_codon:yes gene_type:complete